MAYLIIGESYVFDKLIHAPIAQRKVHSVWCDCQNSLLEAASTVKEIAMFRSFFNALIVARQATAARRVVDFMSDSQLKDMGYDRSTFVEGITIKLIVELDAQSNAAQNSVPVNANLVGAL